MTELKTIVRFAPSPTGRIHIGNVRTALFNALIAMKEGGEFILRLDDTDQIRSTQEFADSIIEDVRWLGIDFSRIEKQSDRFSRYDEVVERLKADGRLYPAYETPDELDRKRARQRARGRPPVYDRAALKLTDDERAALEAEGRKPHWRFLLKNHDADPFAPVTTKVSWADLCRGEQTVNLATLSDPVLVRADGSYLYTLTSVVDDIDMGITHVVRGEDHVTNAGAQVDLFRAMGAEPPAFGHHNLLTLASGEALSKRTGALSIGSLRDAGIEPEAVVAIAVLIGTSESVRPIGSLGELSKTFLLNSVSRAPARFDPDDIGRLNARMIHEMPFADAQPRLAAAGIEIEEALWLAIQGNLETLSNAGQWQTIVSGEIAPIHEPGAEQVLQAARDHLPDEPWDETTWSSWTAKIREETGAKGKGLFMPLRLALTAQQHGPELAALLPLIGRTKVVARLAGQAA